MTAPKGAMRQRLQRRRETDAPNAGHSPLVGYVEHPMNGASVDRQLVVSGWHAWNAEPVAAVVVEANGLVRRAQAATVLRDDVAADRDDPRFADSGWVAELDLRAETAPTITLHVTVFPAADRTGVVLEPITVELQGEPTLLPDGTPIPPPNAVRGQVDVPAPGALIPRGPLTVRGWATTRDAPVQSVELWLDDHLLGRARLGINRDDVASTEPWTAAPVCGFEQTVDLGSLKAEAGTATFRAEVVALDGTAGSLAHEVELGERTELPGPVPAPPRLVARDDPSAPLHLVAFTHDLGLGGAQLWLVELLRRSRAGSSYPCTVVSFAGGALVGELREMGVEVHVTSPLPVHDAASYEGRLDELAAWLTGRGCNASLVNTFRAFPGADLSERLGLPVVWAVHESWPASLVWTFDHPGIAVDPAVRSYAEGALAGAGAVIFESEATRALYDERAPGRTLVVPYGVDTAALDRFAARTSRADARRQLGLDGDGRILLAMGTVEPRKGQSLLAEAFAQVASQFDDVSLALVGDFDSPYSRAIRDFVERAGIADRVRLEPVTADANLWYRACDALVCASDVESLPRSVLDAMCLGLPVLSTSVFGLAELLTDAVTGLLFEPLDLAAAIGGLERLLSMDHADLAAIATRGAELVHRDHDSTGYASDVLALLEGLRHDPAAAPSDLLRGAGRVVLG